MKIKIMKIITSLILPMLLFSLLGCFCDEGEAWRIDIVNNLHHSIYAIVVFKTNSRFELGPILPGEMANEHSMYIFASKETPHKGFSKISIFTEDRKPFMILQGEKMDEYVIYVGRFDDKDESGAYIFDDGFGTYIFRLEVKEEYEGIGLNKKFDVEEVFEDVGE